MKKYLLMDIGCIECGEASEPLGIFETLKEAEAFKEAYLQPDSSWGRKEWSGQHSLEIFEVEV